MAADIKVLQTIQLKGSGCDSVGRAVAFDTRGPQFESSHRQTLYYLYTVNCIEKTKIKKKEVGNRPFLKKFPAKGQWLWLSSQSG